MFGRWNGGIAIGKSHYEETGGWKHLVVESWTIQVVGTFTNLLVFPPFKLYSDVDRYSQV